MRDRGATNTVHKQPWNAEKIRKRGLKLIVFFIISFFESVAMFSGHLIGQVTVYYNIITDVLYNM